jgi:hypothetical protein
MCKEILPLFSFGRDRYRRDGLTVSCKACTKLVREGYRAAPKPVITKKSCTVCNCVKPIDDYYKNTRKCKSCISAARKVKAASKPVKQRELSTRAASVRIRLKRQTDTLFKLRSNIGTSIANALAAQGYKKTTRTAAILGCSFQQFKQYLESQFLPGMSWINRNLWHIDHHIVPVSFANNEQELLMLNHYTNLRPLWIELNLSKGGAITSTVQQHPLYKTIMENRF